MNSSSYGALLRSSQDFRRLWSANLISLGGDWFNTVALLGLVLELTNSGFYTAFVLMANLLPQFLFATVAGPVADRVDRKKLIIWTNVIRIFLALGMLFVRTPGTVWIGIAFLAAIATLETFSQPASGAALPNLVERQHLPAANALMGAAWGTMLAVGAALGGVVTTLFGRDTSFMINAASFALAALLVSTVKGTFSQVREPSKAHPLRDAHEGLLFARSDPRLIALLATKGVFGIGFGLVALFPIFATRVYHRGDLGIGILYAARGVGVAAGPLVARSFIGTNQRRLFLTLGLSMMVYGVMYVAFAGAPNILIAALLVMIAHLGSGSQWVMSTYALQQLTPDLFRGRILAIDMGLVGLTMPMSGLLAGRASEDFSPHSVLIVLALISLGYAVVWTIATRRIWHDRTAELLPMA